MGHKTIIINSMEQGSEVIHNKKEGALPQERLKRARDIFIERYEALLRDPDYQPPDQEEIENLQILKKGGKIKPYRIATDMAARVSQEKGVWASRLPEVAAVYDELFIAWRQSGLINYDPKEWEEE